MSRECVQMQRQADPKHQNYVPKRHARDNYWFKLGVEDENTSKIQAVHAGFDTRVYKNLKDAAQLSQAEFSSVTAIPTSTLKRRVRLNERFNVSESDVIYRLAMLVKLSTQLFGGDLDKAGQWMKKEVYGLGHKRPIDMVSTSIDFQMVQDLIGRIEHGIFS